MSESMTQVQCFPDIGLVRILLNNAFLNTYIFLKQLLEFFKIDFFQIEFKYTLPTFRSINQRMFYHFGIAGS